MIDLFTLDTWSWTRVERLYWYVTKTQRIQLSFEQYKDHGVQCRRQV